MAQPENPTPTATQHAPAERLSPEELKSIQDALQESEIARLLIEALPELGVVLNRHRQILAVNSTTLGLLGVDDPTELVGLRPGEAVNCVHSRKTPGGCGTTSACRHCGAVNAILEALETGACAVRECRIRVNANGGEDALDLRVKATPMTLEGYEVVVLSLTDISDEKRREVLERVFFHDVLNTAGGIYGLSEVLLQSCSVEDQQRFKRDVHRLAEAMIEEIQAHRQLVAAERGALEAQAETFAVADVLDEVVSLYRHHAVAKGKTVEAQGCTVNLLTCDLSLLRRVLGNLVKNALEAAGRWETVTVSASGDGDEVIFAIHNPGVIPEEIQAQIFQRSFSTKAATGRGIGTYSVKLFAERYLGGRVWFTSREPDGTTFCVAIPRQAS